MNKKAFILLGALLGSWIHLLFAQDSPPLAIQRSEPGMVRLSWPNTLPNVILESTSSLRPPIAWLPVPQTPAVQGNERVITVAAAGTAQYFRLRANDTAGALTQLAATSPAHGESSVAVTRETIFRFSQPLAPNTLLDASRFHAEFGGRKLLTRSETSADRMKASLFYQEPLPSNARIRVTLKGSGLTDVFGRQLDLDGDDQPGGDALIEFDTVTLTPIAKTAVIGRVFASQLAPGPNGLDNSINRPLAGVTITVDGQEESLRAVTDDQGNFKLDPAPAGVFFVHIDGRTSPESKWPDGAYYPSVGKSWTAAAGRENNLAGGTGEIYLPLITPGTLQPVSSSQETTISFTAEVVQKNPSLDGVQITVPPNSLYSDNGARGGKVGIAPVPPDRLPSPLPPGLELPLVITIQTDGPSNFDVPVPVRFPNLPDPVTGKTLPPGAQSALWSFNHDTGEWEIAGPMTVSADGKFVVSDPGTGVLQPGWHGTRPGTIFEHRYEPEYTAESNLSEFLRNVPNRLWNLPSNTRLLAGDNTLRAIAAAFSQLPNYPTDSGIFSPIVDDPNIGIANRFMNHFLNGSGAPINLPPDSIESTTAREHPGFREVDQRQRDQTDLRVRRHIADNPGIDSFTLPSERNNDAVTFYGPNGTDNQFSVSFGQSGMTRDSGEITVVRDSNTGNYVWVSEPSYEVQDRYDFNDNDSSIFDSIAKDVQNNGGAQGFDVTMQITDVHSGLVGPDGGTPKNNLTPGPQPPIRLLAAQPNPPLGLTLGNLLPITPFFKDGPDRYVLLNDGSLIRQDPAAIAQGPFWVSVQDLQTGVFASRRLVPRLTGLRTIVTPRKHYRISVLDVATLRSGWIDMISADNGRQTELPFPPLRIALGDDSDGDGLSNVAEEIVGTKPNARDTDGDGLSDAAEIQQGLDPLGGLIAQTGVIASVPTPGAAVDICAINDLAVVANLNAGVSVLNVFSGLNPVMIAQVDTPGEAKRVTCSGNLIAVADGSAGLAIIDISNPANARVIHGVHFPGQAAAEAVAAAAGLAYVGTSAGKIHVVDMTSGSILETLDTPALVHDLVVAGDTLFALTRTELIAWSLAPEFLQLQGRIPHTRYFADGIVDRKRLFVGGGYAYASVYPGYDVFDVRNPAALKHVGLSRDVNPNSFKQIVLNGSGLGIAAVGTVPRPSGGHDVYLYDVTNPTETTRFLGIHETPGIAWALSLYNGLAYVADGASGLQVVSYLPYDAAGQPPSVTISHNLSAGVAEEGKPLRVSASVTDDIQVRAVELYLDGTKILTDGNFPFEFWLLAPIASPAKTNILIQARATDTGGNAAWSEILTLDLVKDATPPRLKSTTPRDGGILQDLNTLAAIFSEPINPATLQTGAFTLHSAGPDGRFGTADDTQLQPSGIEFREEVNGAFLLLDEPLPAGLYRAEITSAVTDRFNLPLANPKLWNFRIFNTRDDLDKDGVPDSLEAALGLDLNKPDSNENGIPDGDEDFDKDGLSNVGEILLGYDPANPDSDNDGMPDGAEDFDKDGIADGEEVISGQDGFITDPTLVDTDGDEIPDNLEVALGLNPTNPGDGNAEVVLDGRTVVVNGRLRLKSLSLINNAVLTHPSAGPDGQAGLELVVNNLAIDATSRIDVTGRGYLGGRTPGNNANEGLSFGNVPGSSRRNGGSHGGLGGLGNTEPTANLAYGDLREPRDLGSGGGSDSGPAGHGGGRVSIETTTLVLNGAIFADGLPGSRYAGGGSGGSILISAATISGDGVLSANGGSISGFAESGGGGGGRISVSASTISNNLAANSRALGGNGMTTGAPGTLYWRLGEDPAQLVIRGLGRETPLAPNLAGENVVIDNAVVSAERLQLRALTLTGGAILTHPPSTPETASRLEITADLIRIDPNSAINVSGRGYLGARNPGNPGDLGRTVGNLPGSARRNGGSYGGLGGIGNTGADANPVYGDYHNPNELGSGGGSDSGPGGKGGGLVRINARELVVNGGIYANGETGARYSGGGSGGGIYLETGSLSGLGLVQANGGAIVGFAEASGGGGGRVAIIANTLADPIADNLQAFGGVGLNEGAPGTLYIKTPAATGLTIVRGTGRENPLPTFASGERVLIDRARVFAQALQIDELQLLNGAVLTHAGAALNAESKLDLAVTRLMIDANSRIDVSGRGYLGGRNGLNQSDEGRAQGNVPGSVRRSGGSHGGLGAWGNTEQIVNSIYGDYRNPNELGSGGGSDSGPAGNGGGLIRIQAQEITLDGAILANGSNGSRYAGGGSGGGIRIASATLRGAGQVQANGGSIVGFAESGGGGGGRIAILYNAAEGEILTRIQAFSGTGLNTGGPGTIYLRQGNNLAQIIVRGAGRETPLPEGALGGRLLIEGARVSAQNLALQELQLINGAILTHPETTLDLATRLELTLTALSIDATSRIDATGRGYLGGRSGPNRADNNARSFGNQPGSGRRTGGSYGGLGAVGNASEPANPAYGSFADPNELGSGGGSDQGPGGNGGGLIRINAQNITLNGSIRANGVDGSRYAGGGSGGGVRIVTKTLTGGGTIQANGGAIVGFAESGTGGGGRIAIQFSDMAGFDPLAISAAPGALGLSLGTPGSIFLHHLDLNQTSLIFDAKDINSPSRPTPLISLSGRRVTSLTANSLTDANAKFTSGALIGLRLKPNIANPRTFRIVHNDAATLFTAPEDGALTEAAGAGDVYAAELRLDRLIVRNRAQLEIFDGDLNQPDRTGRLHASEITLQNNALLTHPATSLATVYGLALEIQNKLSIDAASALDVSSKGYPGGLSSAEAGQAGLTFNLQPGSTRRNGGGYGGLGAFGNTGGTVNPVYGDFRNPNELGSGGGSDNGPGGAGGGRVLLRSGALDLAGLIAASGGPGSRYAGGGSGGSINITTAALSGDGAIRADGGSVLGFAEAGGGGGGRIAIQYATVAGNLMSNTRAFGGAGLSQGAPGTIYSKPANGAEELAIRGSGRETPLPEGAIAGTLIIDGATVSAQNLALTHLRLQNGAVLTHPFAALDTTPRLVLNSTTLHIDATSRIDVTARGYLGGLAPGNTSELGRTLGNAEGSTARRGGSYGGLGGAGNVAGASNPIYGDPLNPDHLGSGGGSDRGDGGNGGGLVQITTQELLLAGRILANGGLGSRYAGGGSGGGIRINTSTLAGGGVLEANGGSVIGFAEAGGGGGGRIAITYTTNTDFDLSKITAAGGIGLNAGQPGTIADQGRLR